MSEERSEVGKVEVWTPTEEGLAFARRALGRRLLRERRALAMSADAAAKVAGVSRAVYQRFESGERAIGFAELQRLAAHYECKVSELAVRNQMPSAPVDPQERLAWVRERNARIRAGAGMPNPEPEAE